MYKEITLTRLNKSNCSVVANILENKMEKLKASFAPKRHILASINSVASAAQNLHIVESQIYIKKVELFSFYKKVCLFEP